MKNYSNRFFKRTLLKEDNLGFNPEVFDEGNRLVNKDGSFNITRVGKSSSDFYHDLFSLTWFQFLTIAFSILFLVNVLFAILFMWIGLDQIAGIPDHLSFWESFTQALFFSIQTFTTVGYGMLHPTGVAANFLASFISFAGFFSFTLFTGLALSRFSRPVARIKFSEAAIIHKDKDSRSLQFRLVNLRANKLFNLTATVIISWLERDEYEVLRRKFEVLSLERSEIILMPINWTIVHEIDQNSPLYQFDAAKFASTKTEILVSIKGFDETYSQEIHANHSYLYDEIVWGATFNSMYRVKKNTTIFDLDLINDYQLDDEQE